MAQKDDLTPMMRQYKSLKEQHPDAILLFRCGDFYETYLQDAQDASQILGITLTRRSNGANKGAEMAGFPYHALDTYLPKLVRAGRRVAICDQLEDPKLTRKLVKRGITELVTPGVALDDNVLTRKENNFLAAVSLGKAACGVAFLDISTGEFLCGEGTPDDVGKLLASFLPKEVLYERGRGEEFTARFGSKLYTYELDDWAFAELTARQKLLNHFGVKSLKGFGIDRFHGGVSAAGAILHYMEMTQHTALGHVTSISRIDGDGYVRLDRFTLRSLEMVEAMHEDGVSLLDVVDRTVSPMGARLLRRWMVFPLRDVGRISARQDVVEHFLRDPGFRELMDGELSRIGDMERIVSRVATARVAPRELAQLGMALEAASRVRDACMASGNGIIVGMGDRIDPLAALREGIGAFLADNPPQLGKGGVVRPGYSPELDEFRDIAYSGKDYLVNMQRREAERTGIASLKVGYNNVFGYYLEVRHMYRDLVPDDWTRKQTLTSAERYITPELKEYEEKILGAQERIVSLEARLFGDFVESMQGDLQALQKDAAVMARMDCLLSLAKVAAERGYVRPVVVDDEVTLDIKQGRHPVIETQMPPGESYVPNDIYLDDTRQQIMMITGPNMAGKSALLRQTALIVLLAQMGSFVPADSARIGVVDKVFTRVGASDNISLGESTFMVEMTEAAHILNNVTPRSLVLFDEIGRGTSTYDGISIAWAIVEHMHERPKARARTLFATHYHELNEMERSLPRVRNYNVSVRETDDKVIFLRKLERGGAEHSFGINVAQIAGMPRSVVRRAGAILRQLESQAQQAGGVGKPSGESLAMSRDGIQLSFFQLDDPVLSEVRDVILGLDIDNLTPVEALNKLNEIKRAVTGRR